jgi:predicted enzyme related to lactoylglutathione lyase
MNDSRPTPQLWFVGLETLDVEASVRFYRDVLGIPLVEVEEATNDPWSRGRHFRAVWGEGRAVFSIFHARPGAEARGVRVGFSVRDLDVMHAHVVAAGGDVLHPPRKMSWGRLARYRDPDGNIVGVSSRR